jgi:GH24 family phage-related lysozyme (muramidase)
MGERKSGPLGLYPHMNFRFAPGITLPVVPHFRLTLPGPMSVPSWNRAPAARGLSPTRALATRSSPARTNEIDYDKLYKDIQRWEGVVRHMYLDTHKPPLVTVGTGNMLPDAAAAQALPFINAETGKDATPQEIANAFTQVAAMKGSMKAKKYKLKPSIEITEDYAKEMALSRLKSEFIPGIRQFFTGFDTYPAPAQRALIDMAYNIGVGRDAKVVKGKKQKASGLHAFSHLKAAAESNDWAAAAAACHSSSSVKRNAWRVQLFQDADALAKHQP